MRRIKNLNRKGRYWITREKRQREREAERLRARDGSVQREREL